MRLTPQEIANSKDQNLIEDWIGEATTEELHEILEEDISHALRALAVGNYSHRIQRGDGVSQTDLVDI